MILERLVARIEAQAGQFDRTMGNIEGRQRQMTQRTSGMWRMFGMAAAAAVIGASVAVTNMSIKFDQSMRQVWTLVDITEAEFQGLKEGVLDVSAAIGESQTVTSRALYQAVSGGVALGEALEFVETAGRAAIAGATDIFSMTSLLVGITNAYASSQITAEHASDVLFTTIKYGVTTAEELGGSLGRVLGIASAAGIAFEDLTAAIAVATKFMGQTDLVVTGLRALIMDIIKPTKDAAEAAMDMGIVFGAAQIKAYGLHGMLVKIVAATEGNIGALAKLMPNIRALAVMGGYTVDNLEEYVKIMAEGAEKTGATTEAMKKQVETGQKMKMFWAGLKADLMPVGDFFSGLGDKLLVMPLLIAGVTDDLRAAIKESRLAEELESVFERYVEVGIISAEQVRGALEKAERGTYKVFGEGADAREARMATMATALATVEKWIADDKAEQIRKANPLYAEEKKKTQELLDAQLLEARTAGHEYLIYMKGAFKEETEALQGEIDRRVAMHKKYVQEVEQLQEKLRADQLAGAELLFRLELDHEQSTLEKMGMLQARAGELESKANKALQEGDFRNAREYADKRLRLLEEITRKVISEGETGAGMTFEDAKAAVEQGIAFQRQMTESSIQYFEALAAEAVTSIEELEQKLWGIIDAAREQLVIQLDATKAMENLEDLTDALQEAIDRVAELDRKLGQAQKKREVPEEAFQHGGWVGGAGGVDRIPALLTAGEFVVQPRAAARHAELLSAINRGFVTPGQGAAIAAGNTYSAGPFELHFHNRITRETVRDVVIPELEAAARRGLLTPRLGGSR